MGGGVISRTTGDTTVIEPIMLPLILSTLWVLKTQRLGIVYNQVVYYICIFEESKLYSFTPSGPGGSRKYIVFNSRNILEDSLCI